MNIDKYFERIERIDRLIRLKATGSPKEFAKKLGISESSLYEYLRYLKDKGGPIEFDKEDNTYFYRHQTKFILKYSNINKEQMEEIKGGRNIFIKKVPTPLFLECTYVILDDN